MESSDPYGLGYHDVDGDPHKTVLVSNMHATAEWQATKRLRAWERRHLGLIDGERLLDVGCGLGDAAISLATSLGTTGELVGVDASSAMLVVARQRSSEAPCAVRFSVGDARSLKEADDSFDAVRSERTLQWLPDPKIVVAGFARVLRSGGRMSLIDTDWSTLRLDVGNPQITRAVRDGLRVERNRSSNVGRRLAELADAAGLEVVAATKEAQTWTRWNPDESPAPDGCFSMTSLAEDLVERGQLEASAVSQFVETIHEAARTQRFAMSLTMHAVVAVLP
ncbi:MAG: methyltransferase domain-containing protein [Actinomycetota bacterium]